MHFGIPAAAYLMQENVIYANANIKFIRNKIIPQYFNVLSITFIVKFSLQKKRISI